MNKHVLPIALAMLITVSCHNEKTSYQSSVKASDDPAYKESLLIGKDIVTETIIKPDPEGDPWESEKISGYQGKAMIDGIFKSIYDGKLNAVDYHTGEILKPSDIKAVEKDFENDRTRIGKLSFTEDWYYNPETNTINKKVKSVAFGYELLNNDGRVFGYKAVFKAELLK